MHVKLIMKILLCLADMLVSLPGERMVDYVNLDDRSIGMFWVMSYTMAQPACDTVMNWFSSVGAAELIVGSNLQSNERVMVMREISPLPMSLLSGFSIHLCVKLAIQMEDSLFSGQVVSTIIFMIFKHKMVHFAIKVVTNIYN